MFLYCPLQNAQMMEFPAKGTNPSSLNWFDFSCPTKSSNGPDGGPAMIASFFESIYFRKGSPKQISISSLQRYIENAHAKDVQLEDSGVVEDFIASDDGYVTLQNFLKCLEEDHKFIKGQLQWTDNVSCLKWMIHKYKAAIVQTYLLDSFTNNPTGFNIDSSGSSTRALRKDYSKVWIAFGYDSSRLLVFNSLSHRWGKLGFAKISWSVLTGNVLVGDEGEEQQKRCFINAAAFKGCFN